MPPSSVVDRDPSGAQLRAALLTTTARTAVAAPRLVPPAAGAVAMSGVVTLLIGLVRVITA